MSSENKKESSEVSHSVKKYEYNNLHLIWDDEDGFIYKESSDKIELPEYYDWLINDESRLDDSDLNKVRTFKKMLPNEKIIIMYYSSDNEPHYSGHGSDIPLRHICVTNHAKILFEESSYSWASTYTLADLEFWLPIDYIKIIQTAKPYNIQQTLQEIKKILESTKEKAT